MAEDQDKTERLITLRNSLQDSPEQCEAFATHAVEAAKKTTHLLTSLSDANSIVANCVLSPNSAMKTAAKTTPK